MTNYLFDGLFAQHQENDDCFLERDGAEDLSYQAFLRMAAQMAHTLVEAGVAPNDRVIVQAPKTVETVALYAATIMAGGIFLPLNTAYKKDEVDYFVGDAKPKLMICDEETAESLRPIATSHGAQMLTLNADGSGSFKNTSNTKPTNFAAVARKPDDTAALLYTSGTTGRSKGAMLTHENLLSNTQSLTKLWQITHKDKLIHALPIFHTHGLFVALNTSILSGASVHFMPSFDVDNIIKAIPNSTMLMGVPTFYTRLLGHPKLTSELCANMRLFVSGSAPLLAETHIDFSARTDHHVLERYGMTETNMNTSNPYSGERRAGTVGQPLPGVEVRLTDPDTEKEVANGDIGMIEVRGPNVFKGYWQMPEKTAAELRENGFFITGDLGQISPDGYLSIVGRAKDLIISGGYNIYPKEVEDVLNDVDGVLESAVFGVPHPDFGETILAAIVKDGTSDVSSETLSLIVDEKLARFKHPRRYEVMEQLPRNAMGKVQKNLLRDEFA